MIVNVTNHNSSIASHVRVLVEGDGDTVLGQPRQDPMYFPNTADLVARLVLEGHDVVLEAYVVPIPSDTSDLRKLLAVAHELPNVLLPVETAIEVILEDAKDVHPGVAERIRNGIRRLWRLRDEVGHHLDARGHKS